MVARIVILGVLLVVPACGLTTGESLGSESADAGVLDGGSRTGLVRGRVTDDEGMPVASVRVEADDGTAVQTDADGRFELEAEEGEVRVAVEHPRYSSAALPVKVRASAANVELTVLPRKTLMVKDAARGGRVEATDGFAIDLPAKALRGDDGREVSGPVEVRYVVVNQAKSVAALPGRMEAADGGGIEGFGMSEIRFYQGEKRLTLSAKARIEVPLESKHGLGQGKAVSVYGLGKKDARWKRGAQGMVMGDKVLIETAEVEWLGAAKQLPVDSCVKGKLTVGVKASAANTTLRAARARGLSLIQADTADDGEFCLPVTPNDDWAVSAYFDDGSGKPRGFAVSVSSADATGMCGGEGCKDVGTVELPRL